MTGAVGTASHLAEIDWNERLLNVAYLGNYRKVVECIQNGADVNYTEKVTERTALHLACCSDDGSVENFKTCLLLINNGASLKAKSYYGRTPLNLIKDGRRKTQLQKEAEKYTIHKKLLQQANRSVDVVKLFLCGAPAVGKTTLKKALTKKFPVPSFLRSTGADDSTDESTEAYDYKRTPGIDVIKKVVRGAGTFMIWDCAGQMEYFLTHGMFLGSKQSIFLVLFDLDKRLRGKEDPLSAQYWLSFIKSVQTHSMDGSHDQPKIVLVATHFDRVKNKKEGIQLAEITLKDLNHLFSGHLNIDNTIFILDGREEDSKELQRLKETLKRHWDDIRDTTLIPKYCEKLKKVIAPWREEHIPVLGWRTYQERVKTHFPILDEDTLRSVTLFLQHMGELYLAEIQDRESQVILNIHWFTSEIIGSAFAGKDFMSRCRNVLPNQPYYTLEEFSKFFSSKMDTTRLIDLLQHIGLLHITSNKHYLIPGKLPTSMPNVHWSQSKVHTVKGRSIECIHGIDILNPGVFPSIQKRLLDMNIAHYVLSRSAVKYVVRSAELMVQLAKDKRAINIAVLCNHEESIKECYDYLQDITSLVQIELYQKSPGTDTQLCYLSQQSLRTHTCLDNVWSYTKDNISEAENKNRCLIHQDNPEEIIDVLFPGFDTTILQEKGQQSRYEWLPLEAKERCFKRLDVEHEWREDYRTVGEALGFPVYEIKQIADGAKSCQKSVTMAIIKVWCQRNARYMTIGMLRKLLTRMSFVDNVDALKAVDDVISKYNRVIMSSGDIDAFELGVSEDLARWRLVLKRLWRQPIKTDLDPSVIVSLLDFLPPDLRIIIGDTRSIEQRVNNSERLLQFILQRTQEDWSASLITALKVTTQGLLANALEKEYQSLL